MRIAVASDHAGYEYKERIKSYLAARGHEVVDFGTDSTAPVDYPDLIAPAARSVADGDCEGGIVFGGSGNGEAIVCNRLRGVRCAVCWSLASAELAKRHNDANMISIGQRLLDYELVESIVERWLSTEFEDGRHRRRIRKIDEVE